MFIMKFKAVLFDLDGTLVDTIDDITDAMNTVLRKHGLPLHSAHEYKRMVGWGSRVLVEKAIPPETHTPALIDECLADMVAYYSDHPVHKTRPYPGVVELLEELRTKDLRLGVYSNKTDNVVQEVVRRLFDYSVFTVVRGALPDRPTKPDPAVALELTTEFGCRPSEVLYLGDSDIDLHTAQAAGMFPVMVTWGFRTFAELKKAGAVHFLDHPHDLLEYVSN